MNIKTEYMVGKISGNDWSGVYGYRPDYSSENVTELFCVARLKSDAQKVELERIAKMLLDEFQDAYYNYFQEEDEIVKLEESLQKMKTKLEVIVSREDEILEKGLDIEMSIALVNQDMMVVGVIGESKIFIYRNGKLVDISKGLVDANMMGFVKTGSLKLLPEDRILLTTSVPFLNSLDKLEQVASNLQIDLIGDISEESGFVALVFADESQEWDKQKKEYQMAEIRQSELEQSLDSQTVANPSFDGEDIESIDQLDSEPQNSLESDFIEDDQDYIQENSAVAYAHPTGSPEIVKANSIPFAQEWEDDGRDNDIDTVQELRATRIYTSSKLAGVLNTVKSRVGSVTSKLPISRNKGSASSNQFLENDNTFDPGEVQDSQSSVSNNNSSEAHPIDNFVKNKNRSSSEKTYQQIVKGILEFFQKSLTGFVAFIKKDVIGTDRLDRSRNAKRLKRNRIIMAVVLVILVVLIYFVWKDADNRASEAKRVQEATIKISQLETEVNQAVSRVETEKNEDQSKKDILNSKLTTLASSIDSQKKEGFFIEDLDRLKVKISTAKDSLSFIKEINDSNLQVVTDVGKLFSDTNLSDLEISNGFLYASDAKRNVVYKVPTALNSTAQEFVKDLNTPAHLVRNAAGNIVVYDSDTTSSIGILNTQNGELTRLAGLSTALIGNVTEAGIYSANDALYELHQNHQQIFKRERVGNSYGGGGAIYVTIESVNWKTDPEFSKAIDIAIPYEIYVLIEGVGLKRYLAGGDNSLDYSIYQGFAQSDYNSISQANAIGIDQNYLAIADSRNKRVMLFEIIDNEQKNLKFLQQFVYRGKDNLFSNIREVVVDQSTNSIYVLDGSRILKVQL